MFSRILTIVLVCALLIGQARAACDVQTGQFAAGLVLPTTTVSSSFQGKCILLFTAGQTANGADGAAHAMWSFGMSDSTNHRSETWAADDAVATTNVGKTMRTTSALEILSDGTPTSVITVDDVNFGATSFDVVHNITPLAARLYGYVLLGGTDITNCAVGSHTMANTTGDKTETGVGFQGDFGIFLFTAMTAAGTAVNSNGSLGFVARVNDAATSRARQFGMSWAAFDGQTMTANINAVSYTNSTNFLSYITNGAETVDVLAQFGTAAVPLGFASDGFRYNISNANATNAQLLLYMIAKGCQWDVGTTTMPSAATRTVSGIAFTPKSLSLAWGGNVTNATVTATTSIGLQHSGFGAATSTSTEVLATSTHVDAILNTQVQRWSESTKMAAVNTSVDFTSFASGEWSINAASANDAVQLGWFTPGDNAVAATCAGTRALMGVGC